MAEIFKAGEPEGERVIEPSDDPSRQLSVFERKLQKVQQEVDDLKAQAKREAEKIISQAKGEAGTITTSAYTEGIEKGKGECVALIDELAATLRREIECLEKARLELLKKYRGNIIDFSFKLAKHIIGEEIKSDPALLEKQLGRILERFTVDGKIDIHVSSEDFETIDTYMRESGADLARDGYEIKVDLSLERGGVRVDSAVMGIDGSIEGMLQRVESVVRDVSNEDG